MSADAAAGRITLVTGATAGLGLQTAQELARRGATVLVHGRAADRAERAAESIRAAVQDADVRTYAADLSALGEVAELADAVERDWEHVDVMVANAGIAGGSAPRAESRDGHELHFAVNHLAHFLLIGRLLAPLAGAARAGPRARIVTVASVAQTPIDFDDVMLERGYEGFRAYAQSKLAQVMFSFELDERLGSEADATGDGRPSVNALHPATLMDTKLVRESFGHARSSVEEGVEATVRLAAADDVDGVSGRYFDGLDEAAADGQAYDPDARRRLWELSEELTAMSYP